MHEQSETIERDGKFYNVYGRGTPKAGQDLPGEKPYDSLDAAVTAAKARSHSFDHFDLSTATPVEAAPETTAATAGGFDLASAKPVEQAGPASPALISRQAGNLGRKAAAYTADVARQMDKDVDYSGVPDAGARAEYGFLDTPEEKQKFLQDRYGAANVTKDSFGRDVVLKDGKKVAFLPRGGKETGKPGSNVAGYADAVSEILPTGGMIAGGVFGSAVGPATAIAGTALGGAAGRAGNKLVKRAFSDNTQSTPEAARDILTTGVEGALAETGGQVARLAGRTLTGPFKEGSLFGPLTDKSAKAFKEAQEGVKAARDMGLQPRVGSYAPSASLTQRVENAGFRLFGDDLPIRNRPVLEAEGGKLTGGPIYNTPEATEALNRSVAARTESVIHEGEAAALEARSQADTLLGNAERRITGRVGEPSGGLSRSVAEDIRAAKQQFAERASGLYAPVDAMAGRNVVPTAGVKDTMRKILAEGPRTTDGKPLLASDTIKKFAADVEQLPNHISFQQMQVVRSTLRDRSAIEALNAGLSESQAARLAMAADDAFDQAATRTIPGIKDAAKALRRADRYYNAGMKRFENLSVEALVKDAGETGFVQPEKVAAFVAQPGMSAKLAQIKKVVSPETFAEVGRVRWQQFLADAKNPMTGDISGKQLSTAFGKMGDTLDKLYGSERARSMREFAKSLAALNGDVDVKELEQGLTRETIDIALTKAKHFNELTGKNYISAIRSEGHESMRAAQWLTEPTNRLSLRQTISTFGEGSTEVSNLKEFLARRIFSAMEVPASKGAEKYTSTELMGEPLLRELNRYGRPYLEEFFGKQWTEDAFKFAKAADVGTRKNPIDSGGLVAASLGLHWMKHLGEIGRYFAAGELLHTKPVTTWLSTGIGNSPTAQMLQRMLGQATRVGLDIEAEQATNEASDRTRGYAYRARNAVRSTALPSSLP